MIFVWLETDSDNDDPLLEILRRFGVTFHHQYSYVYNHLELRDLLGSYLLVK